MLRSSVEHSKGWLGQPKVCKVEKQGVKHRSLTVLQKQSKKREVLLRLHRALQGLPRFQQGACYLGSAGCLVISVLPMGLLLRLGIKGQLSEFGL